MRCPKCGWRNESDAISCVHCGYSFMNSQSPSPKNSDERATRIYNPNELPDPEQLRVTRLEALSKCPECGYQLLAEYSSCPYCGTQIRKSSRQESTEKPVGSGTTPPYLPSPIISCPICNKEISAELSTCPYCGESIPLQTVRVVRHRVQHNEPKCSLTIIVEEDEQMAPYTTEYEGAKINLNRHNTDSSNNTITSKVQATLTYEDGHWFINNQSEHESTFIQVNRRMELTPGDIIMLGDRCFRFATPENDGNTP